MTYGRLFWSFMGEDHAHFRHHYPLGSWFWTVKESRRWAEHQALMVHLFPLCAWLWMWPVPACSFGFEFFIWWAVIWHYKLNSNPKSLLVRIFITATELKARITTLLCARLFFPRSWGNIEKNWMAFWFN